MLERKGAPIPLKVLICDADGGAAEVLSKALLLSKDVLSVEIAPSLAVADAALRAGNITALFIDPITLGLEETSSFIFDVRKKLTEIVVVLYIDRTRAESIRSEFYQGERQRFTHYITVDKQTPVVAFPDEIAATIKLCQEYLQYSLTAASIERLRAETVRLAADVDASPMARDLLDEVQERLAQVAPAPEPRPSVRRVYLSHRFADKEYVAGITELLDQSGFEVVRTMEANTFIGKAVIADIRDCNLFLSLMTRDHEKKDGDYTTSPWLLEEKGVALALGKQIVLMVEEGVSDYGAMQGDWQRIQFGTREFLTAALKAVRQLKSYVGEG